MESEPPKVACPDTTTLQALVFCSMKHPMRDGLTLSYEFRADPSDDFGWLESVAFDGRVSASNGYWVQWQDVAEFAQSLARDPAVLDLPLEREWGFTENGTYTPVTFFAFYRTELSETVFLNVDLADFYHPERRWKMKMETTMPNLTLFGEQLTQVMAKSRASAVLKTK